MRVVCTLRSEVPLAVVGTDSMGEGTISSCFTSRRFVGRVSGSSESFRLWQSASFRNSSLEVAHLISPLAELKDEVLNDRAGFH